VNRSSNPDSASTPSSLIEIPKWETLTLMRVVARSSLKKFRERPRGANVRGPLQSWNDKALRAKWRTPQDIKNQFASASICGNNRVLFDVGGNTFRFAVKV
jgi:mRNA interferase HigB